MLTFTKLYWVILVVALSFSPEWIGKFGAQIRQAYIAELAK